MAEPVNTPTVVHSMNKPIKSSAELANMAGAFSVNGRKNFGFS